MRLFIWSNQTFPTPILSLYCCLSDVMPAVAPLYSSLIVNSK